MRCLAAIALTLLVLTGCQTTEYALELKRIRPLAEQGDAKAQYNLGQLYHKGHGATQDYAEAVRWYRKAAKQGDAYAQYWLGEMYRDGEGVMQDLVMAYVWYNVAATNGNNIAKARRDKVLKRLADLERRLAVKLSRQCHEKPASCPKYSS